MGTGSCVGFWSALTSTWVAHAGAAAGAVLGFTAAYAALAIGYATLTAGFGWGGELVDAGVAGMIAAPVLVRLGEIMGDEALRPPFCQTPNPAVDSAGGMREGKVVIIRIPSRDFGEMAIKRLCHWIVLTVFLTKLSLGGAGAPTWLVLNEPR